MTTYTTRRVNSGFDLQICKIGSSTYARIMFGDKIAARFDKAPLTIGLRSLYSAFDAFDFSGIAENAEKQAALRNLAPTRPIAFCA